MKEFTGKIIYLGKVEQVGKNSTNKIDFVLEEVEGQYPNSLQVSILGDKVKMLDGYKVGDVVTASLNVKANEYNGKYYNNVSAWKLDKKSNGTQQAAPADEGLPF